MRLRKYITGAMFWFCAAAAFGQSPSPSLTIVTMGDAGDRGGILRGNAKLLDDMRTGQHDGGRCNVLVLLGNDFGETGLNVPKDDVSGALNGTLGFFRNVMSDIGAENVHGVPGESDYYARKAVEKTALFGLITLSEWTVGLSDRGVQRAAESRDWSFHYHYPAAAFHAIAPGSPDSVELFFFDSALLLRTPAHSWGGALDSLRKILAVSRLHPGVRWRLFFVHHPLASAGEHGGYSIWNDEDSTTQYVSGCDRDSNAYGYVKNWLDPEDLCTDRYRAYTDSIAECVRNSGVVIQAFLSAHDRSLQLLSSGDPSSWRKGVPPIQIISGCGSETTIVEISAPPNVYTAGQRNSNGLSLGGFVQLKWRDGGMVVTFFNERNGDVVNMGGKTEFVVREDGTIQ